jgi:hypothetical protein
MKKKDSAVASFAASGFLLAALLMLAHGVFAQKQGERPIAATVQEEARFPIGQARKIALRQFPGTIERERLVKENGTLLYLLEIRDEFLIFVDVKIDATTGKVLFDEKENSIPKVFSNMKNGSVNSLKSFGQGIRSAANLAVGLFPH